MAAYRLERINEGKDIPYNGLAFGPNRIVRASPTYLLSAESQKYEEARDREAIDTFIEIIFSLGMEQGRRISEKEISLKLAGILGGLGLAVDGMRRLEKSLDDLSLIAADMENTGHKAGTAANSEAH